MTITRVLLRVWHVEWVVALTLGAVSTLFLIGRAIPETAVYPSVPAVAPCVFLIAAAATVAATVVAVPRVEALEVTSVRSLAGPRSLAVATLLVATLLEAGIVCVTVRFPWFFEPLVRAGLVAIGLSLGAATVLQSRYVSGAVLAYVVACFFVGRGSAWWDVLLAHPGAAPSVAAAVIFAGGTAAFIGLGPRTLAPEDEL